MKNHTFTEHFTELGDVLKSYFDARIKLWKILILEKFTKAGTYLFTSVMVLLSSFIILMFLGFAFSFWYGENYGSFTTGFLISAGIMFLIMVLLYLFRKLVFSRNILKKNSDFLFEEDELNLPK